MHRLETHDDTAADMQRDLTDIAAKYAATRDAAYATPKAVAEATKVLPKATTLKMLGALFLTGKHVYAGTVPAATVATNRRRNKAARAQRRVNRNRNFRKGVR